MNERQKQADRILDNSQELPFSYIEAYKSLRTNLQFFSIDKSLKRILVTSSIPSEGKTTVAINLAITLAETDSKVLLIDCDLRKPTIHKYLHISSKALGVTNILSAKSSIDECTVYIDELNISVIAAGSIPPNPTELLTSARMSDLVNQVSEQYDYIVMDTPPVSLVTDAAVMSKNSDGVLFVVRHNYTRIESARLAKTNLENIGAHVIGCVLNAFKADQSSRDYAYYSHYKKRDYTYTDSR